MRRNPDATALVQDEVSLSYGELNRRANRLAHHLIGLGVRPDERVAICLERSPAMVVGLLAILKAGGAYVPLDPAYPSERLGRILADAGPRLLLTDGVGRAVLGEACSGHTVLALDRPLPARPGCPRAIPIRRARPHRRPPRLRHLHLRIHRNAKRCHGASHRLYKSVSALCPCFSPPGIEFS